MIYVVVESATNDEFSYENLLTSPLIAFKSREDAVSHMEIYFQNEYGYSRGGTDITYSVLEIELK